MKTEIAAKEVMEPISKIRHEPDGLFEMTEEIAKDKVGQYLNELMGTELSDFPGCCGKEERIEGADNHRTGACKRKFTLKGIGKFGGRVPRDR